MMKELKSEIERTILFPKTANPSLAAADAIQTTRMCQALNALPRAGGLLDQDAWTVVLMQTVLVAEVKKAEADQKKASRSGPGHKRT